MAESPDGNRGTSDRPGDVAGVRSSRPLSALPSRTARALAFIAILIGGFAGLIGFALVDVQCTGDCDTARALGVGIGAITAAAGTAVVAVLVLRAMGEWHEIQDRQQQ